MFSVKVFGKKKEKIIFTFNLYRNAISEIYLFCFDLNENSNRLLSQCCYVKHLNRKCKLCCCFSSHNSLSIAMLMTLCCCRTELIRLKRQPDTSTFAIHMCVHPTKPVIHSCIQIYANFGQQTSASTKSNTRGDVCLSISLSPQHRSQIDSDEYRNKLE